MIFYKFVFFSVSLFTFFWEERRKENDNAREVIQNNKYWIKQVKRKFCEIFNRKWWKRKHDKKIFECNSKYIGVKMREILRVFFSQVYCKILDVLCLFANSWWINVQSEHITTSVVCAWIHMEEKRTKIIIWVLSKNFNLNNFSRKVSRETSFQMCFFCKFLYQLNNKIQ